MNLDLPVVVVREAWSIARLTVIHEAVSQTIVELGHLVDEEEQAQARSSAGDAPSTESARRMALRTCTLELMNEAGLDPGSLSSKPDGMPADPGLELEYNEAIDRYRVHAAMALRTTLGVTAREADPES